MKKKCNKSDVVSYNILRMNKLSVEMGHSFIEVKDYEEIRDEVMNANDIDNHVAADIHISQMSTDFIRYEISVHFQKT